MRIHYCYKLLLTGFISTFFSALTSFGQLCDSGGNVIIYTNYDGGIVNININENIPNIKVGICTYEAATINISGTYAANVTEVRYAGYNSYNDNCSPVIGATTINGVGSATTSISFAPPATLTDANGYGSIICGYSCGAGNQGGCNTAEQIVAYFLSVFSGDLRFVHSQYACWNGITFNMSTGGNCCPETPPVANFEATDYSVCVGDCISFSDLSTGNPDTWSWTFNGAQTANSSAENPTNICYNSPGNFSVVLSVSNAAGNSSSVQTIAVETCNIPGCTYPNAVNYNPDATVDDLTCTFECNTSCEGDFDGNGIIGVSDLIQFIALYGTSCPN